MKHQSMSNFCSRNVNPYEETYNEQIPRIIQAFISHKKLGIITSRPRSIMGTYSNKQMIRKQKMMSTCFVSPTSQSHRAITLPHEKRRALLPLSPNAGSSCSKRMPLQSFMLLLKARPSKQLPRCNAGKIKTKKKIKRIFPCGEHIVSNPVIRPQTTYGLYAKENTNKCFVMGSKMVNIQLMPSMSILNLRNNLLTPSTNTRKMTEIFTNESIKDNLVVQKEKKIEKRRCIIQTAASNESSPEKDHLFSLYN